MGKKKILVTAGPVWVPIDSVRVLTNRFTGKTGYSIARGLANRGFEVVLLLGPSFLRPSHHKNITVCRFTYFDQLCEMVDRELKNNKFSAVIHTAAIADYEPKKIYNGKIKSKQKELNIELKPTPKIIKDIRLKAPDTNLIQFKLEVGLSKNELIDVAYTSLKSNKSDFVVANDLSDMKDGCYKGILIAKDKSMIDIKSKRDLVNKLSEIV